MRSDDLTSFYQPSEFGMGSMRGEVLDHKESVRVTRLDSVCKTIDAVQKSRSVLLKIDTQGHDLEVFRGAQGCLPKVTLLLMERSVNPIYDGTPDWKSVIDEVTKAGFAIAGMFAVSYDEWDRVIEFDCLFVPRDGSSEREAKGKRKLL